MMETGQEEIPLFLWKISGKPQAKLVFEGTQTEKGGVKLCLPLEDSCRACRSQCGTWPSLAYPALAPAQC